MSGLFALAALVAVPLAALGIARLGRTVPESLAPTKPEEKPGRPNVVGEIEGGSEPGGTPVVLGLFGAAAAVGALIAAFVFPPAYVAAVLVFGLVSLLGLVALFVHYRAHHPIDPWTD